MKTGKSMMNACRVRVRQRRAERAYFAVDNAAAAMLNYYWRAISEGAPRQVLARVLTGLAGCELAMAQLNPAMGWGQKPDEDGCTVGESAHRSGLLLLELACAAGDPAQQGLSGHKGAWAVEFQTEAIAGALRNVALAYQGSAPHLAGTRGAPGEPVPVGRRLTELHQVVVPVIGSHAAEALSPLIDIHADTLQPHGSDTAHQRETSAR